MRYAYYLTKLNYIPSICIYHYIFIITISIYQFNHLYHRLFQVCLSPLLYLFIHHISLLLWLINWDMIIPLLSSICTHPFIHHQHICQFIIISIIYFKYVYKNHSIFLSIFHLFFSLSLSLTHSLTHYSHLSIREHCWVNLL